MTERNSKEAFLHEEDPRKDGWMNNRDLVDCLYAAIPAADSYGRPLPTLAKSSIRRAVSAVLARSAGKLQKSYYKRDSRFDRFYTREEVRILLQESIEFLLQRFNYKDFEWVQKFGRTFFNASKDTKKSAFERFLEHAGPYERNVKHLHTAWLEGVMDYADSHRQKGT